MDQEPSLERRGAELKGAPVDRLDDQFGELLERLGRVEAALTLLVRERTVKDWYTTAEVAGVLGKAEFTVREWCRLGRINAQKRLSGRGAYPAWCISREELLRYQREGLLVGRTRPSS
jgi:hypothetical protein